MQPDPRVFLPAIRREILRPDFLGKALTDGLTPILVMRAAEGLAQLELRQQRVPEILRALAQRQRIALAAAVKDLAALRIATPAMAEEALALRDPSREPGEAMCCFMIAMSGVSAHRRAQWWAAGDPQAARALRGCVHDLESHSRCERLSGGTTDLSAARRAWNREAPPRPAPSSETLTAALPEPIPATSADRAEAAPLPGTNAQEIHVLYGARNGQVRWFCVASEYNATPHRLPMNPSCSNSTTRRDLPVARVLMAERDQASSAVSSSSWVCPGACPPGADRATRAVMLDAAGSRASYATIRAS
jgi:hypothetical protein